MPPKRKATPKDDATSGLWPVSTLAEFLRSNSELPQSAFRKQKFFEMLSGHALALLQAFLEVKSAAARQWFMQNPWPEKQDNTLIPATTRWLDKVQSYIALANRAAGATPRSAISNFIRGPINGPSLLPPSGNDLHILPTVNTAEPNPLGGRNPGFETDRPIGRGPGALGDLT